MGVGGLRKAMDQAEEAAKAFRRPPRDKMMRPADVANKELRSSLVRTRRALNELDDQIKDVLHKGIR
jgi:hypothetical protein